MLLLLKGISHIGLSCSSGNKSTANEILCNSEVQIKGSVLRSVQHLEVTMWNKLVVERDQTSKKFCN